MLQIFLFLLHYNVNDKQTLPKVQNTISNHQQKSKTFKGEREKKGQKLIAFNNPRNESMVVLLLFRLCVFVDLVCVPLNVAKFVATDFTHFMWATTFAPESCEGTYYRHFIPLLVVRKTCIVLGIK